MNKIISEISSATFLLALLTGLLYISGDAYHSGYLEELSLNPNLFSPQLNEILSQGFYMLFVGGVLLIFPSVFIAFIFCIYIYIVGEISEIELVRKIWNFLFSPSDPEREYKKPRLLIRLGNLALSLFVFFIFIAALQFTIYKAVNFSSEQGRDGAIDKLDEIKKSKIISIVELDKITLNGDVVKCSETHCAIYLIDIDVIRVVPIAIIKRIDIKQTEV